MYVVKEKVKSARKCMTSPYSPYTGLEYSF
jgi:hypothetical protein